MKKKADIKIRGKKPRLLYVEWVDIISHSIWRPLAEAEKSKPKTIVTVGFEVVSNKEALTVAASVGEDDPEDDDKVSDTVTIPRGCIKSIRVIE